MNLKSFYTNFGLMKLIVYDLDDYIRFIQLVLVVVISVIMVFLVN